jgi:dephospho-CoA kinase
MPGLIIAFVGMTGSGKSTAAQALVDRGWGYVRFGQVTIDRLREAGMEINPDNEKMMRESLRREHGMGVFAQLSLPAIEKALETGNVVIDGLYSWSEYKTLKEAFGDRLQVVAICASPRVRYARLEKRTHDAASDPGYRMRPLTVEQAQKRDRAEIENIEKGGPIAMADYTMVNEARIEDLIAQTLNLAERIVR